MRSFLRYVSQELHRPVYTINDFSTPAYSREKHRTLLEYVTRIIVDYYHRAVAFLDIKCSYTSF